MASNPYTSEDYISSERDPLLKQPSEEDEPDQEAEHSVSKSVARRLYISNFLSTWKSRVFEFGTVLYLAAIYPDTLLPMSVYAFTRGFSAIIFAPAVGQYIDKGNRLQAGSLLVRSSILNCTVSANSGSWRVRITGLNTELKKELNMVATFFLFS